MKKEENDGVAELKKKRGRQSGKKEASGAKSKPEREVERQLKPLRKAARHIAELLCEFSCDKELFFSDSASERRLDTKTLKEFSAVLKEVSAVMSELCGENTQEKGGVRIEFSGDALDMGF
jgi:hypothetical protein